MRRTARQDGDAGFRPYLFGIAKNVLREHYRGQTRNKEVEIGSQSVADLRASPSRVAVQREDHRLLLAALREVSLDEQVVLELELVGWESFKGKEVAAVLGVPEGTARTRIRSARQSLEAALARLTRSAHLLQSTLDNLEAWSASIRESLADGSL